MNRPPEGPANISLFPLPPWELVNKYTDTAVADKTAPSPPTPPASEYSVFGNSVNLDDPILRPLETYGIKRVYPQIYNRKSELKKLNFSILANYLDLLDIITRDPSSPKRTEKLEKIGILFVNMHHLLNEYRPHQARDLFREILRYQVKVARETVTRGEQYWNRVNEVICVASHELNSSVSTSQRGSTDIPSFADLDPDLASYLTDLQNNMKSNFGSNLKIEDVSMPSVESINSPLASSETIDNSMDPTVWVFLKDLFEDVNSPH